MKLTTLMLFIAFLQVSAASLAQRVTLSANKMPLTTVLTQIKKQTGYDFILTSNLAEQAKPVTINVKNQKLNDVLEQIFDNQPLDYKIEDQSVTVSIKETGLLDKIKAVFTNIDASGKVVDERGQPLAGATVSAKNTNQAAITDAQGSFTLKNISDKAVLIITFIGYEKKEVTAAANLGTIQLSVTQSKLDEVHVIAYGKTSQRLSTGNETTVSSADIEKQPVNNPLLALEGLVPSLFISQTTGFSGGGVKVLIQGQNSLSKGNDPFYVIDGVPYISELLTNLGNVLGKSGVNLGNNGNPLSYINPSDIESITVLKDADATAIYGSRASNGAILITTKRGKTGQTTVDFKLENGWGRVTSKLDLLNTQQYLQMRNEALRNDGIAPPSATDYDINGFWDQSRYTDWQKVLIGGTAKYTNYNATVSGGSANTQFLVGATYHKETTVFPGDFSDQKAGLHFSLTNTSDNQKFKLLLSASYLQDNNQLPNDDLTSNAMQLAPDAPALYNADGSLNWMPNAAGTSTWTNPLSYFYNNYQVAANNLVSNAVLSYQLLPGLMIKSNFGYTNLQMNETVAVSLLSTAPESRTATSRRANYGNSDIKTWIIEPQVTFDKAIAKGKLSVLLGTTIQENNSNGQQFNGSGYNSDAVLQDVKSAATVTAASSTAIIYKYNALFGRLNYNWADKYIINFTARRDGSSRFGPDNQFHNFAAAGAAWIFSEEPFVKNNLPFLSFGKLKASYGTTGNDQIGDYSFLNLYNPTSAGVAYQGATGLSTNTLFNPYLQWEETQKTNIGIDLGFFKDRALLNINYFRNRSSNEILSYTLPLITGSSGVQENFPATFQNSGLELSINGINIKTKTFQWSTNLSLSLPQPNKLLAFPGLATSNYKTILVIGQPITLKKLYHFLGVDPATGVYLFQDSNGNPTSNPNFATDANVLANAAPTLYGGLQNSFSFNGFHLDFTFQFVKQKGFNSMFGIGSPPGYLKTNQPVSVLDRWQAPGDVSDIQRYNSNRSLLGQMGNAASSSDAGFGDASYIRLKNLSLSWQLPESWNRRTHMKNSRIYVQGQNLLTFTKYIGLDPETLSSTILPPLKVIVLGIQTGF